MEEQAPRIYVIGVGNLMLGDESVGVRLARTLARETWPDDVRVVDAATGGFALVDYFAGAGVAVVMDAADMGLDPGKVRVFSPDEVRFASRSASLSLHDVDVMTVLNLAARLGPIRTIWIVGVQPVAIDVTESLSPALEERFDEYLDTVRSLVARIRALGTDESSRP
jgi:hydrogenase maturation protease